jgi:nucleoside-diphosphate-sugar epimerase
MRVLVLGGTGAMGTHLVRKLVLNGVETTVTSRSKKNSEENLRYLNGNAKDLIFLQKVLDEHWDAIVDFMVYSTNEFRTRVELLLNSTKQYIFLSSGRVYANSTQPLNENSNRILNTTNDKEYLATDEYALAKARQEDILKNSKQKNWTIIRPYITYSENRLQLGVLEKEEWLYRALNGRTIVFSNDIATKKTTMTYGSDVSKGIFALIGNKQVLGNSFHITCNDSYTWAEILAVYLQIIENKLGFRPKVLLKDMDVFFNLHPAKYQIEYDRLFNRQFDNAKIGEVINASNFTPIREGLNKCLSDFIKNPLFNNINWKTEALKDKHTSERTNLKEITGFKQRAKYVVYRYFPIELIKILKKVRS